jgi:hypothetical protein
MITHDMLEALLLADRIAVMRAGVSSPRHSAGLMSREQDDYVRELMATPRRQVSGQARSQRSASPHHEPAARRSIRPAAGYLGGHVAVSVTALILGLRSACRWRCSPPAVRACEICFGYGQRRTDGPSLALLARYSIRCCSAWRRYANACSARASPPRVPAVGAGADALLMLPVLRNTITGLNGVDAAIKEAALGIGMTQRQSLAMVELRWRCQ